MTSIFCLHHLCVELIKSHHAVPEPSGPGSNFIFHPYKVRATQSRVKELFPFEILNAL